MCSPGEATEVIIPAAQLKEVRGGGVVVTCRGDMTIKQVAKEFGIAGSSPRNGLGEDTPRTVTFRDLDFDVTVVARMDHTTHALR